VNDDQVKAALAAALRARTRWDESPGLYFISESHGVRERSIFDRWPPDPTFALPVIAEAFEENAAGMAAFGLPHDFVGVAFRCEAWMVNSSKEEFSRPEMQAMRRNRQLHTHPDRVETRVINAVVRGGKFYMASQAKGSQEIATDYGQNHGGLVPVSLRRMVTALSGGVN
jgi:hypothetical protein